jgi:L,D-peptidoglycan transpeptidase YkuD (ErfK/YbiS/YcfS/YnhG family)/predicted deacylase
LVSVIAGDDPDQPHRGRLSVGDWTAPCVIGRNGLVEPHRKREGDGATPIGVYPLRYGFYDPHVFEDAPRGFAFPFVPKPQEYDWVEDPDSIHYNRLRITANADRPDATQEGLFDLFVPIGWNDASPRAGAGSAIFLHAARPDMRGTRGCVAIPHDRLLDLARRLRPGMMISIQRSDCRPLHALLDEAEGLESVSFQALEPGPRVIVLGGVHGNEPCGPAGIAKAMHALRSRRLTLEKGSVTFVPVANPKAYRINQRAGDRNLNRALSEKPLPLDNEDRVANLLCPLLRGHDVLLDLHSFGAAGEPFALVATADEARLAAALSLPLVLHGWMTCHRRMGAVYPETAVRLAHAVGTTEYMRFAGGSAITVECGSHGDPNAATVAYRSIVRTLRHLGLIAGMQASPDPCPELWEIVEAVPAHSPEDRLEKPFAAGEAVVMGQQIGRRAIGTPIVAPFDARIIFASRSAPAGEELCFLCRPSSALDLRSG